MPQLPITPPPGICLSASTYAVGKDAAYVSAGSGGSFRQGQGRWVTGTNVEFIAGFPQKIAGWGAATASAVTGAPRAIKPWRDNAGDVRVGIGTENHLYYVKSAILTDITPLRTLATGTLTDAITTTSGSQLVAITDASQTLVNGDWVFLSAASAVGGVLLNNWYQVSSRTGSGYNITVPVAATSSAGPGGGAIAFQYPRITLSNPFTTTSGLRTVSVNHVASGATAGAFVTFSGASAVGGLTINGEYAITSITDADNYVITAATPAASSAGPGGGSVSVTYDIVVQQDAFATGIGYGMGAYGVGAYQSGLYAIPTLLNGWTLDAYGNQLLAAPIGGTIYIVDPVFGGRAYPMLNAPVVLAMFVTPERFVVGLGVNGKPLQMAWCDQSDYTVWTTTPINTANTGRTLVGGSYFVGGIAIRDGVSLIFTDRCAFQMNYIGSVEIYATPQIGDNCGLAGPVAVCAEGGIAYWSSDEDFWTWNGGVSPLPSDDIRDFVFNAVDRNFTDDPGQINRKYSQRCAVTMNRTKRQVRFWYPAGGNAENSFGVLFQYDAPAWSILGFGRSAAADAELLAVPVSLDTTGILFFDEIGVDANGSALPYSIEMGPMDVSNGDRNADIFTFTPDFQYLTGDIDLTINVSFYPADIPTVDGPYTLTFTTQRQDLRSNGKLFGFELSSDALGGNFRLGVPRLEVNPAGARR